MGARQAIPTFFCALTFSFAKVFDSFISRQSILHTSVQRTVADTVLCLYRTFPLNTRKINLYFAKATDPTKKESKQTPFYTTVEQL